MRLRYAAFTSPGREDRRNEDAVLGEVDLGLFAVADGVGRTVHAAEAARTALAGLRAGLLGGAAPPPGDTAWDKARLIAGVQEAHRRVRTLAEERGGSAAATLLAAWVVRGWVTFAHVGDGAAWLWRETVLERVCGADPGDLATATVVRDRLHRAEAGLLQAIGVDDRPVVPRIVERRWRPGDWLLLATDGVVDRLSEAAIANRLVEAARRRNPASVPEALVRSAQAAGARDDCTVLIAWRP